jgi:hypothetical protein
MWAGVLGKALEGGKAIGSAKDLWNYVNESPWARFGKHSFEGGWRKGEFDYVGNTILGGERLVIGFAGIKVGRVFPDPSPSPGPPGGA